MAPGFLVLVSKFELQSILKIKTGSFVVGCWCYYIAFQELFVHEYCLERDKDSLKALSPVLSSEFQVS